VSKSEQSVPATVNGFQQRLFILH